MSSINLILGTMTFGESVFYPEVERFVYTFLDLGYKELDTAVKISNATTTIQVNF